MQSLSQAYISGAELSHPGKEALGKWKRKLVGNELFEKLATIEPMSQISLRKSYSYADSRKWPDVLHSRLRELVTPKRCVGSDRTRSRWKTEFILSRDRQDRFNVDQPDTIPFAQEAISTT